MTRSARRHSASDIYHVVARGVNKVLIFEDDKDRNRFMNLLAEEISKADAELYCWCLMGNHFHLLLRAPLETLSSMLKRFLSSYALYFNTRHGRSGHLFQDRFRSEPVDTERYLFAVVRYIHYNPVNAGISKTCDYPWSSYNEYLGSGGWTSTSFVLGVFGSLDSFVEFHETGPDEQCLDVPRARVRISDDDAIELANQLIGKQAVRGLGSAQKDERDDALRRLHSSGLSIRQIQRITGVGRNIIERASRQQ